MRIEVHTIPALGHINPLLAYVKQEYPLQDVTVYAHPSNIDYIKNQGFSCVAYPNYNISKITDLNFFSGTDYVLNGLEANYPFIQEEWKKEMPGLIISDFLAHWAIQQAKKHNVTTITTFPVLVFTPFSLIFKPKLLLKLGFSALFNITKLISLNARIKLVTNSLGIKGLNSSNLSSYTYGKGIVFTYKKLQPPLLHSISKHLSFYPNIVFNPLDFPVVNYTAKSNRIYLSLGTLFNKDARLVNKLLKTLAKLPVEVIYSRGGSSLALNNLPKNIQVVDFLNQEELLKTTDLAIIGGGMNTVRDCIRLNVPMLVAPVFFDQHIQADLVSMYGLGERYKNLSTIVEVLNNLEVYKQNIARFKQDN